MKSYYDDIATALFVLTFGIATMSAAVAVITAAI